MSLTISIIATIIMLLVLLWRACRQQSINQPFLGNDLKNKHKETLKEVFPFLVYLAIFCCTSLFPFIHCIKDAVTKSPHYEVALVISVTNSMIGFFSSTVLIIHMMVVKFCHQTTTVKSTRKTRGSSVEVGPTMRPTQKSGTITAADTSTKYMSPAESEVDKLFEY